MTWKVDPSHSSFEFAVKHMLISTTRGSFHDFDVDAEIDEQQLANSHATVTASTASIDTREEKRDAHLRSADFFDAETFPRITYVTKSIESTGGSDYRITGVLSIRGQAREVVLDAEIAGPTKDPWGSDRIGISAHGKLSRKDWGMTWNAALETGGFLVGDEVKLNIELELVKAA